MQRRPRNRTQMPDRQLDLLNPSPLLARCASPEWTSLPDQTRRALTDLVTRLLIEHAGDAACELRSCADDR
jgi:hypothetical protein